MRRNHISSNQKVGVVNIRPHQDQDIPQNQSFNGSQKSKQDKIKQKLYQEYLKQKKQNESLNASSIDQSMVDYKPPKVESSGFNRQISKPALNRKPMHQEGFKQDTSSFSILLDQSIVSNTPRGAPQAGTNTQRSKGRPPLQSKPQKGEEVFDKLARSYLDMKQNNFSSQSPPPEKVKSQVFTPAGPSPARGKVNDIGLELDQEYIPKGSNLLRDQSSSSDDQQPQAGVRKATQWELDLARQRKMQQELGRGNSNQGQRTRGQTARMVKGQKIQSQKRNQSNGAAWENSSAHRSVKSITSKGEKTFTTAKTAELKKATLVHKQKQELLKAKKKGKNSKIFLSKNCKLYHNTEIKELEEGNTPALKLKSKIEEVENERCSISDCSSVEQPESEIKLKNKRKVQIENLNDKKSENEEDKPSAIGTWFKDIFAFCGTGNKGCLGKEKQGNKDDLVQNYGMEQKKTKVKLQSFNNPHRKAKRKSSYDSSSESGSCSSDSVKMKQKKMKSLSSVGGTAPLHKGRKHSSSSSELDTKRYEDLEKQFRKEEAKREKERALLKQRLKEEKRLKAEERKKIAKDKQFHLNNPVGTKKKKTVTILDYRSPTIEGDSSSISSVETPSPDERRRKKNKKSNVKVHSESDEENSCYISDCSSLKN